MLQQCGWPRGRFDPRSTQVPCLECTSGFRPDAGGHAQEQATHYELEIFEKRTCSAVISCSRRATKLQAKKPVSIEKKASELATSRTAVAV